MSELRRKLVRVVVGSIAYVVVMVVLYELVYFGVHGRWAPWS